ncbi:MAG: hypothetical protein SGPRY_010481, partial [Prymnesium sp.]
EICAMARGKKRDSRSSGGSGPKPSVSSTKGSKGPSHDDQNGHAEPAPPVADPSTTSPTEEISRPVPAEEIVPAVPTEETTRAVNTDESTLPAVAAPDPKVETHNHAAAVNEPAPSTDCQASDAAAPSAQPAVNDEPAADTAVCQAVDMLLLDGEAIGAAIAREVCSADEVCVPSTICAPHSASRTDVLRMRDEQAAIAAMSSEDLTALVSTVESELSKARACLELKARRLSGLEVKRCAMPSLCSSHCRRNNDRRARHSHSRRDQMCSPTSRRRK